MTKLQNAELQSAKLSVDPSRTISMICCMDQFYKLLKEVSAVSF